MQLEREQKFNIIPWTPTDIWLGMATFGLWVLMVIGFQLLVQALSLTINPGIVVSLAELALLIPVWFFAIKKYGASWQMLGLCSFDKSMISLGFALMLLSFCFNIVYALFLTQFNLQMQPDLSPLLTEGSAWLFIVGGAIIAPLVEEIFFRGFVFAGLYHHYGWQKAAVGSAALFALIHLTPTAFVPIFILGYIFAYLYYRSGSIWPSILMHVLTNSIALGSAYLVANAKEWEVAFVYFGF